MTGTQGGPQDGWTRFTHGHFECTVVSDGPLHLGPARGTFPDADPGEIDALLGSHGLPADQVTLDQNLLIVNTGEQLVLFDTGVGINAALGRATFGSQTGQAIPRMRAAGIDPADIDIVAITHTHPDHCWGLVDDDDQLLYPNAQVALSEADFAYWTDLSRVGTAPNEHMKDHFRGAHKNLMPYKDRLRFLSDGTELVPGITAVATPGHSPGHLVYRITSAGRTMICWGDLCHHQVLLLKRPEWGFLFDYDRPAATRQRVRIYDQAVSEDLTVFAYHFPFPGRGHLDRDGEEYTWVPDAGSQN
ncbi:MBL fold metallo-hydrolase [Streptomyces sp. NPDC020801]|uniref:MBL fold metallo-hydrolase n=1 Tax=unclassified Streptomyces TaxID=2593676 RepID=UPI0037BAC62C